MDAQDLHQVEPPAPPPVWVGIDPTGKYGGGCWVTLVRPRPRYLPERRLWVRLIHWLAGLPRPVYRAGWLWDEVFDYEPGRHARISYSERYQGWSKHHANQAAFHMEHPKNQQVD